MKTPKQKLKLLCIADLHNYTQSELDKIKKLQYDVCFLLGDIPDEALKEILRIVGETPCYELKEHRYDRNSLKIYAIEGNHDAKGTLEQCGIKCIDRSFLKINGYRIWGLSGSSRYKYGGYTDNLAMLTQEESLEVCRTESRRLRKNGGERKCDILISHDSMYRLFSQDDPAHIGLKGISKFIKRNKVKLHIFGHHHQNTHVKKHGCDMICVYRCAVISLPELTVENIF